MGSVARAARRRKARDDAKRKGPGESTVTLVNPVSDHFPAFIIGNALVWQVKALLAMQGMMPDDEYAALVHEFEQYKAGMAFASSPVFHDAVVNFAARYFVQEGEAKGQTLVICGAGPSLREHAAEYTAKADQVWGCNSAVTWLANQGHNVTHGFTVDQTAHMAEEWASTPDVEYLVATTAHPDLSELLVDRGARFRFFHNFVGIKAKPIEWPDADGNVRSMEYEDWMYTALFPTTCRAGSGLNSVTRAIDVANVMGFERIYVLGADCALQYTGAIPETWGTNEERIAWLTEHTTMHADGGHALASEATPITMHGEIDGRVWLTKPDMAISAQWLVKMANKNPDRLELVGDTLPNAMRNARQVRKPIYDSLGHQIGSEVKDVEGSEAGWSPPHFIDHQGNAANIPV